MNATAANPPYRIIGGYVYLSPVTRQAGAKPADAPQPAAQAPAATVQGTTSRA